MVEGRKKDLDQSRRRKISRKKLTNLILSHPAVKNVACIAFPRPRSGANECALAFLLKDGAELRFEALKTF